MKALDITRILAPSDYFYHFSFPSYCRLKSRQIFQCIFEALFINSANALLLTAVQTVCLDTSCSNWPWFFLESAGFQDWKQQQIVMLVMGPRTHWLFRFELSPELTWFDGQSSISPHVHQPSCLFISKSFLSQDPTRAPPGLNWRLDFSREPVFIVTGPDLYAYI